MTDKQIIINKMDKPKRYCEGIDCAWCNEKEPCIYKIANELEEKLLRKEQECFQLANVYHCLVKIANHRLNKIEDLQQQLDQLKAENEKLKAEKVKCYQQTLDEEIQINYRDIVQSVYSVLFQLSTLRILALWLLTSHNILFYNIFQ